MENFRKDLENLETRVYNHFFELIKDNNEFVIFREEDLEDDSPDDYLEVRNDITGNVFDVHPLKVTNRGIEVVEVDDNTEKHLLKFSDLSSIVDKINLCEMLEIIKISNER